METSETLDVRQCPACQYELTLKEQMAKTGKCPACDIYFHKWQAQLRERKAQAAAEAKAAQRAAPPPPPGNPPASFRLTADPVKVATQGLDGVQPVVVVDIHMRFWSMVVFMVKAALAAIPAMIILVVFFMSIGTFLGSLFIGAVAS